MQGNIPLDISVIEQRNQLEPKLGSNKLISENSQPGTTPIDIPIKISKQLLFPNEQFETATVTTGSITSEDTSSLHSTGNASEHIEEADTYLLRNDIDSYYGFPDDEALCYMIPTHKTGKPKDSNLTLVIIMVAKYIGASSSKILHYLKSY